MPQQLFFATKADIETVLAEVESAMKVEYVRCGSFPAPAAPDRYSSATGLPKLGEATGDSCVTSQAFLVVPVGTAVHLREAGGHVLVDQLANADSVVLAPGGMYAATAMVAGRVSAAAETPVARKLFNAFVSQMKKRFRKVGAYYVGPEAESRWKTGLRLAYALQSPEEYDLRADAL